MERLAVIDAETFAWDLSRPFARPDAVPACWQPVQTIVGTPAGAGVALLRRLQPLASLLPGQPGAALARRLQRLVQPQPAQVYRLPPGC